MASELLLSSTPIVVLLALIAATLHERRVVRRELDPFKTGHGGIRVKASVGVVLFSDGHEVIVSKFLDRTLTSIFLVEIVGFVVALAITVVGFLS